MRITSPSTVNRVTTKIGNIFDAQQSGNKLGENSSQIPLLEKYQKLEEINQKLLLKNLNLTKGLNTLIETIEFDNKYLKELCEQIYLSVKNEYLPLYYDWNEYALKINREDLLVMDDEINALKELLIDPYDSLNERALDDRYVLFKYITFYFDLINNMSPHFFIERLGGLSKLFEDCNAEIEKMKNSRL